MNKEDQEIEIFKSKLRREEMLWQQRASTVGSSDAHAVQIGLVALRTAVLVNAGAIVALLALAGRVIDLGKANAVLIFSRVDLYLIGLVCAIFASGIAYFYQSIVTVRFQHDWQEASKPSSDDLPTPGWVTKGGRVLAWMMVALVFASFTLFVWASFRVFGHVVSALGA